MDVTASEAFRLGFLSRCAEEGLTGDALTQRIENAAEKRSWVWPLLAGAAVADGGRRLWQQGVLGAGRDAAYGYAGLLGAAAAGGLGLGAGAGYGLAKATEPDITDDDIRAQELTNTYKILADKARAKRKAREYRPVR